MALARVAAMGTRTDDADGLDGVDRPGEVDGTADVGRAVDVSSVPGDGNSEFARQADPFRRELLAYCYRMLGCVHDAEDLLQETLLRAWRAYDRYDPARASFRTWLYRIATNACLTALEQRSRRPLPAGIGGPPGTDPNEPLVRGEEVPWLEPAPDARFAVPGGLDGEGDPGARDGLRLAFVAAMQLLPARQRAVLILREVLDWPAAEVAAALDMTPAAVNSLLQRAHARLGKDRPREEEIREPDRRRDRELIDRYVTAFERADLAGLAKLLADAAVLEMPPFVNWYVGRDDYIGFIRRVFTLRGTAWRMLPVGANGQPAVAAYVRAEDGSYQLHTLQVFTVTNGAVSRNTVYQDEDIFALFELPEVIGSED
jgi:RNA polymerase sigma-70 factor, ECF subfamily